MNSASSRASENTARQGDLDSMLSPAASAIAKLMLGKQTDRG